MRTLRPFIPVLILVLTALGAAPAQAQSTRLLQGVWRSVTAVDENGNRNQTSATTLAFILPGFIILAQDDDPNVDVEANTCAGTYTVDGDVITVVTTDDSCPDSGDERESTRFRVTEGELIVYNMDDDGYVVFRRVGTPIP